ncbi:hypothetical protein DXT99_03415 [Pontibacter diazotrophicus]|uniref:Polysaccharide lyase n=1 Tax=Pontibacter diazotrophicus TaxID=1400979 RepID=A0A3D8LHD0_9BACT|nr:polysaccharide lyase [Pontibacter diazotrophicus]RDV16841.1 hypothetical protein DXT99_03415 [Pontibacter diazotrophicus]
MLFTENFEGSTPFSGVYLEKAGSHSLEYVTSLAFQGSRSARFELRDSDAMVNSGTRAEAMITKPSEHKERWYSFAVYFPSQEYAKDSKSEIISQWHQYPDEHLGEKWGNPANALLVGNDRFTMSIRHDANALTTSSVAKLYDLGSVAKDQWHEFVFHHIHSYGSDGLVEIWHNGKKVLEHKGGNMFNNAKLPHWKLGLYKWEWNAGGTTDVSKRVLYFDNIRVGNQNAQLSEMSSGATATPENRLNYQRGYSRLISQSVRVQCRDNR